MNDTEYQTVLSIFKNSKAERTGPPIRLELWRRSLETSLDFVEKNLTRALCFDHRSELHAHALSKMPKRGLVCEFGVFRGASVNAMADALVVLGDTRTIYGFDSFLGLGEDWAGHFARAGEFNLDNQLPKVQPNVELVAGWIKDSLPGFLNAHPEPFALVHIDTDTYTPCKQILTLAADRFVAGSIIIFDELLAYPGWQNHEYRALIECVSKPYEFIAFSGHHAALVFT